MPATFINSTNIDRIEIDKYLEGTSLTYIWDKTKDDIGDRFIVLSSADTIDKASKVNYRMSTLRGSSVKDTLPEIYKSGILNVYEEILKSGNPRYCGRLIYEDDYLEKTEYDVTAIPCLNCRYKDIECNVDIIFVFYKELNNTNIDTYMKSTVIEDVQKCIVSIHNMRLQMNVNSFDVNNSRRDICNMLAKITESEYSYMNKVTYDDDMPHKQIVTMLSDSVVRDCPTDLLESTRIDNNEVFVKEALQFLNTSEKLSYNKSLYSKTVTIYNEEDFKIPTGKECPFKPNGKRLKNIMILPLIYNYKVIGHICVANSKKPYTEALYKLLLPLLTAISDFKMAYEQLRYLKLNQAHLTKNSELQRQFFGNLSHELRTPMNSINVASKLLLGTKLTELQSKYANLLSKTSTTMMGLIEDLIQMTRFESGNIQATYENINVTTSIDEIVEMHKVSEPYINKNIRLLKSYNHNDIEISCDKKLFKQLVSNIIHNSIKFTEKGFIEVKTSITAETFDIVNASYLCIEIEDTGIGIEKHYLEKIFERFVQVENGENYKERTVNGLGLGLSIVTNIVEILKGTIDVQSTIGVGTKFIIKIPILKKTFEVKKFSSGEYSSIDNTSSGDSNTVRKPFLPNPKRPVFINSLKSSSDSSGTTFSDSYKSSPILSQSDKKAIVLVEDVQTNIDVIKLLLENYKNIELTHIFTNGQQFYDWYIINEDPNILVLMDAHMPVLDGYQTTRQIRRFEIEHNLTKSNIVGLSASVINGDQKADDCGMDYFMDKPINIDIFDKVITNFIGGNFISKKFMESL